MIIIEPGTETDSVYHRSGAWGSTLLNLAKINPTLAHWIHTGNASFPDTAAMRFGRQFHSLLDPRQANSFIVGPCSDRRTKAWKEAEENAVKLGKEIITPDDDLTLKAMAASVRAHRLASALMEGAEHEVGFRMKHESITVQARADVIVKWSHICDIKTTSDLDEFSRSVQSYAYHRQAAFYRWIISHACGELLPFSFICSEKQPPFRCRVVDLSDEYLDFAWRDMEVTLKDVVRRSETGDWSDPFEHVVLSQPKYTKESINAD